MEDITTPSSFTHILASGYLSAKDAHPGEGRRKWLLRAADAFWNMDASETAALVAQTPLSTTISDDDDPWDAITDAPVLGLVLRTDFSDEAAWQAFLKRLQDAEEEIASEVPDAVMGGDEDDEESDEEVEEVASRPPIFAVVDPSGVAKRHTLEGISNLGALRLLCDVGIRASPPRPPNIRPISSPHRLIDQHGFQEIYDGKGLWIYDTRSNANQSVRVVSPQGDMYGTATGDSWRARVGHICELQLNMASGALKIDFGGLDRWDHNERERNLSDAVVRLS